jgi:hypothetical protein
MRRTTTYPQGSRRAVPGFGGFQSVATILSAEPPYIPVSRQGVYSWYKRRARNGFPEMKRIAEATDRLEGLAFDLEEARVWYAQLQVKREAGRAGSI